MNETEKIIDSCVAELVLTDNLQDEIEDIVRIFINKTKKETAEAIKSQLKIQLACLCEGCESIRKYLSQSASSTYNLASDARKGCGKSEIAYSGNSFEFICGGDDLAGGIYLCPSCSGEKK